MIFLTSLLGMMAIGSFAFLGVGSDDDEPENDDGLDPMKHAEDSNGEVDPDSDMLSSLPNIEPSQPIEDAPVAKQAATDTSEAAAADDTTPPTTSLDSALDGTEADDLIYGTAGDDVMRGFDGSDMLDAGEGDDIIDGGDGPDDLYGDLGDDTLSGGTGHDTMNGGDGADSLRGGTGDDALHGRDGNDTLLGDRGQDTLFGADGDDLISGVRLDENGEDYDQRDYLNGGNGDDTIIAGEDDIVFLGAGADVLVLGEWMTETGAEILDYDDEEDQLMVVYDDALHDEAPELEMRLNADNSALTEILLGDEVLATLSTEEAPDLGNVVLIGESSLIDLGLDGTAARHVG